jgi:hypothetical protein
MFAHAVINGIKFSTTFYFKNSQFGFQSVTQVITFLLFSQLEVEFSIYVSKFLISARTAS